MVDLDFYLDFPADGTKAAELPLLVVVVGRVELGVLVRQLDAGDEEVVLLVRRVSACREQLSMKYFIETLFLFPYKI